MLDGLSIDCWVHWAGVVKLESRNMGPGCQGQGNKGRWPWESGGGGNPHRRTQKGCQVETLCVFIGMRFFFKVEGVAEVGAHSHWVPLREGRRRLPGFYSSAGPG